MIENIFNNSDLFKKKGLLSQIILFKTAGGCMVYVFAHHSISDLRSAFVLII